MGPWTRTRLQARAPLADIAREPGSGAPVLPCDSPLTGLDHEQSAKALETFIDDADDAGRAMGLSPETGVPQARALPSFSPDDMIIIRR